MVALRDGRLAGHSTDGDGFVASLDAEGVAITDRAVCVLGAGGAARSIVEALARNGAAEVVVVNRSADRAGVAAALAGPVGRVVRSLPLGVEGVLDSPLPRALPPTTFARAGDGPAILMIVCGLILALQWRRRNRRTGM